MESCPIVDGIVPVKLLQHIFITSNLLRLNRDAGSCPLILVSSPTLITTNSVKPSILEGIWPFTPESLDLIRLLTRPPAQVIPAQFPEQGSQFSNQPVLSFQLSPSVAL